MIQFNFWDWEKQPILVAIFKGQIKAVGQFKRNVFVFSKNKTTIHSWDFVDLRTKMYSVPFDTKLRIEFLGNDTTGRHPRKQFDIKILKV